MQDRPVSHRGDLNICLGSSCASRSADSWAERKNATWGQSVSQEVGRSPHFSFLKFTVFTTADHFDSALYVCSKHTETQTLKLFNWVYNLSDFQLTSKNKNT